ncbi:MAG TPA: RluA family pseudouridine synthase [Pirellulaceae bacterium]|nr:RluA family pseudouridine synthase [Pirellulaceae bacterium]
MASSSDKSRFGRNQPQPVAGTWHVEKAQSGWMLERILRHHLPDLSWARVRQMISKRRALINGNLCLDAKRAVRTGDVVKVVPQSLSPLPTADNVELVFVDQHVVVVNKPPGMTSVRHPHERGGRGARKQHQKTLDELLPEIIARLEHTPQRSRRRYASENWNRPSRFYAVHRLDRDTSGLMVFARTLQAAEGLTEQFRLHTTRRAYQAVVHGRIKAQRIETRLVRDRGDGRRGSTEQDSQGKLAVTHVRPLRRLGPVTLVECRLETGRTHQIRIHLSELGHPLCGDNKYPGSNDCRKIDESLRPPRLALHAVYLRFMHPVTGQVLSFNVPLPRDLQQFVKRLESKT